MGMIKFISYQCIYQSYKKYIKYKIAFSKKDKICFLWMASNAIYNILITFINKCYKKFNYN